ncbi:MAG: glycoside hydrolase family 38 C-terminal domain-containing protein, partial [Synechococcus sp.]
QVGTSELRLDLRLRADCPWVELVASVNWQQRHEVLRLEVPLARKAVRLAADTSGGVIERPALPYTLQERERWEVPVISWWASQTAAPGGGLAVLLDGPQGVDASPERMGISLLRGATWPDPSGDQGRHRLRVALLPLQGGWAQSGLPQASIAFREPGWHGPIRGAESRSWLPALPSQLCPVALRSGPDGAVLRLLNPGASRCSWAPGDGWQLKSDADPIESVELGPGELVELQLLQSS